MKVKIIKKRGIYFIEFGYGDQSFELNFAGDEKEDVNWTAKMLRKCFKNYKDSLIK